MGCGLDPSNELDPLDSLMGDLLISVSANLSHPLYVTWGCVAREENGQVIKAWNASRDGCMDPVGASLLAIREGQLMAYKNKWSRIAFLINVEEISLKLNQKLSFADQNGDIAKDIYLLSHLFEGCIFLFDETQCGGVCDKLAVLASNGFLNCWDSQFPSWIN